MSWMSLALSLAKKAASQGEVPVGAVLIYQGQPIAQGYNKVESWQNPLAHAEMLVILQAQKKLYTKYLEACDLYVTLQPCPLCMAALNLCRLRRLYFGAYASLPLEGSSYPLETIGGIQETSCKELLQSFFKEKRSLLI